jgi:hypothetical protein
MWVRILWAWIISEVSSYVGSLYDANARHVSQRDKTVRWMEQNQISDAVVERYKAYEECRWHTF